MSKFTAQLSKLVMPQLSENEAVFNWKKLETTFRTFAEAINENMPLEGDGIRIVDTEGGKLISVASDSKGKPTGAPTQDTGGGGGGPTDGAWMTVTIVDPSTCAQSQIQVWSRPVPS